jgi:hypothetical protein
MVAHRTVYAPGTNPKRDCEDNNSTFAQEAYLPNAQKATKEQF